MVRMNVSLAKLKFSREKRIRQNYPEEYIDKLLDSMNKLGQIYEILIDENWEVHVGGGRYLAAKKGNWERIKVDMRRGLSEDEWYLLELHENVVRRNLDPVEEVVALAKGKEIYERLYPETKQYIIAGKKSAKKRLTTDNLTVVDDQIDVKNKELKESFTKAKAKEYGQSERTIRRKVELGTAIREGKINLDIIEALRKKKISRNKVMQEAKHIPKISSKPEIKKKENFCRECKKGVPLFCPECKNTFLWCQRYKNPYLRRELDKVCKEFEKK